eukprot:TRINITY_DN3422_c0_g2_i1.p1 TRINITY_DN3422_c0_g2~~TRINITY_DN3422_c0_g2_i1.p1  ORF type:complete len:345 (-),score=50.15 TRINITY_DN3422_c0_g2_i1:260-1294(-)
MAKWQWGILTLLVCSGAANRAPTNVSFSEYSQIPHDGDPLTNVVTVTLRPRTIDLDGDPISHLWECPPNQRAEVTSYTGVFTPGVHTCQLTAADSFGASTTGNVTVTVASEPNVAPVANAGAPTDWMVPHDESPLTNLAAVILDGSNSSDADGDQLKYSWSCDGAELNGGVLTTESVVVVELQAGNHTCTLTVSDPYSATSTDTVEVWVRPEPNSIPIANAGTNSEWTVPHDMDPTTNLVQVTLDGSKTSDPDGDRMSHRWVCGPAGEEAVAEATVGLSVAEQLGKGGDTFAAKSTEDPNVVGVMLPPGTHTCTLTSTDTYGATATDTTQVLVHPEPNSSPNAS